MTLRLGRALLAASLLAASWFPGAPARAQEPPGTPRPSRGAPNDRPGAGDPFGSQGERGLSSGTSAEDEAARRQDTVERIEISGNRHTGEDAIRARLAVALGKPLTAEDLRLSRVRLLQFGTFSRVAVETAPGSAAGLAVVRIRVEEKGFLSISDLTVAHTPVSQIYGALGLAYANVAGLGVSASVTAALDGHGRHGLRLSLYDPAVGRGTLFGGLQATWQEGLESACASARCDGNFSAIPWVRYRRAGGELDVGWRPGLYSRVLVGYRLELVDVATDAGAVADARPPAHEGRSILSAAVLAFDYDSRDDTLLPSRGSRVRAQLTLGTAALGGGYEYTRYLVQGERWFPQGGGRGLRLDAAFGLIQGDAPFFEKFYAADWSYFSVGLAAPRLLDLNFSPDSRYDAFLIVVGAEYDFTLWRSPGKVLRRGILALGIRGVHSARVPSAGRSVLSATPVSVDAALRVDTPLGVVSIGLGYVTDQILKAVPLRVPGVQFR